MTLHDDQPGGSAPAQTSFRSAKALSDTGGPAESANAVLPAPHIHEETQVRHKHLSRLQLRNSVFADHNLENVVQDIVTMFPRLSKVTHIIEIDIVDDRRPVIQGQHQNEFRLFWCKEVPWEAFAARLDLH